MNNYIPFFLIHFFTFSSLACHSARALPARSGLCVRVWFLFSRLLSFNISCDTNLRLLYLALNFRHFRVQSTNFFNVTLLTFRTFFSSSSFHFLWLWFISLSLHCNCFCSNAVCIHALHSRATFLVNIHFGRVCAQPSAHYSRASERYKVLFTENHALEPFLFLLLSLTLDISFSLCLSVCKQKRFVISIPLKFRNFCAGSSAKVNVTDNK